MILCDQFELTHKYNVTEGCCTNSIMPTKSEQEIFLRLVANSDEELEPILSKIKKKGPLEVRFDGRKYVINYFKASMYTGMSESPHVDITGDVKLKEAPEFEILNVK